MLFICFCQHFLLFFFFYGQGAAFKRIKNGGAVFEQYKNTLKAQK